MIDNWQHLGVWIRQHTLYCLLTKPSIHRLLQMFDKRCSFAGCKKKEVRTVHAHIPLRPFKLMSAFCLPWLVWCAWARCSMNTISLCTSVTACATGWGGCWCWFWWDQQPTRRISRSQLLVLSPPSYHHLLSLPSPLPLSPSFLSSPSSCLSPLPHPSYLLSAGGYDMWQVSSQLLHSASSGNGPQL